MADVLGAGEPVVLAGGDGVAFFVAEGEGDGLAVDGLAAAPAGETEAATGAGGGGAGAGGGGVGAAEAVPSQPAPAMDWLPATRGDTGGVELSGVELPPNSTVTKT